MLIKVYGFDETIKIDNIKELISKNMYNSTPIVDNEHVIGIVNTKKTYLCNDGLYVDAILYGINKSDFQKKYKYKGTAYYGRYVNVTKGIIQVFDVKQITYLENKDE